MRLGQEVLDGGGAAVAQRRLEAARHALHRQRHGALAVADNTANGHGAIRRTLDTHPPFTASDSYKLGAELTAAT